MNFFKVFSFCAAVIAAGVGCVSADEVVLHLESDVGPRFAYECGYDKKSYNDINGLACGLDVITNGKLSAVDGSVDLFGDSCDYDIVGRRGDCHDLLNFDGFCYSGGLSKITFFGGYNSKPSVRLRGSGDDLQLPIVECKNIPMFHLDEDCPGLCRPSMEHFITDSKTGLEYKYPIRVDGKNCNNAGADICVVARPGKNLFSYPGKCNVKSIGRKELYAGDISDRLKAHGYSIIDIYASKFPVGKVFKLASDSRVDSVADFIVNNGAGKVSLDLSKLYYGKDHTRGKLFHPVLKSCFIQFREGDKGWRGSNDIINIETVSDFDF